VCLVRNSVHVEDPNITCVSGDLTEPATLTAALAAAGKLDAIFHLGASLTTKANSSDANVHLIANAVATQQLLQSASPSCPFIFASSATVIGKPEQLPIAEHHPTKPGQLYSLSKLCGELCCEIARQIEGRHVVSLRITSPYGPGMNSSTVLPRYVQQALGSQPVQWFGSGQRTQNFCHVDDVVSACILALLATIVVRGRPPGQD